MKQPILNGCPARPILVLLLALGCGDTSGSATAPEPRFPVTGVSIERGAVREMLETFGTIELDPEHTQTLTSPRSGQVGVLDVVAGEVVKKGDSLMAIEAVPAGSLEGERGRIDLEFAQRDLERVKRMAELKLATNREVQTAERQLESSRLYVESLGLGGSGKLALKSPMGGVVAAVLVTEGALVQPGQELVQIAPADAVVVRVGFEVEEMPHLSEGLTVLLEPVFHGPSDAAVEARLSRLHRVADPATQLVEGLVRVVTPPEWAVAGTRARVRVVLGSATDVPRVPQEAILTRGEAQGVFVVDRDRARFRIIETGVEGEGWVEVRSGLEVGQQIVLAGRSSLSDGSAVRVAP